MQQADSVSVLDASARSRYDAFISYRSKSSGRQARRLRNLLYELANRHRPNERMEVFLDVSALKAGDLASSISEALASSGSFVLLLDRETKDSSWVNDEIETWLSHDPEAERLFLVRTDPALDLAWDRDKHTWARPDLLPSALRQAFGSEPKYVDLLSVWSVGENAIELLYAPIIGIDAGELGIVEAQFQRRRQRVQRNITAGMSVLLALALIAGMFAWVMFGRAQAELRSSTAANLSAQAMNLSTENPRLAALSALSAHTLTPSDASASALFKVAEANESVKIAKSVHPGSVDLVTDLGSIWGEKQDRDLIATHSVGPTTVVRDAGTLDELDRLDLPGPVTYVAGYSVTARNILIAQADALWYASEVGLDGRLGQLTGLEAPPTHENEVVWAGRLPTKFAATFVVVTVSGAVFGWDSELRPLLFPAFQPEGALAGEPLQAVGRDASRWGKGRILGAVRNGTVSTLLSYEFSEDGKSATVGTIGDVGLQTVTALAETPTGIVVGTDQGAALLGPALELQSYPLGGVTGRVRQIQLPQGSRGFLGFLLLTEEGTFRIDTSAVTTRATAGPVAASAAAGPGYILGHPDGRVSIMGEEGDLRTVLAHGSVPAAFGSDGLLNRTSRSGAEAIAPSEAADLLDANVFASPKRVYTSTQGPVVAKEVVTSPDSVVVAGQVEGQDAGGILVFDRVTQRFRGGFQSTRPGVYTSVAISPNESLIAAHHESGQLDLVDLVGKRRIKSVQLGTAARVGGFSSDGEDVLAFSDHYRAQPGEQPSAGLIRIPVADGAPPQVTPAPGSPKTFAVSPSHDLYAVAAGRELRVVELASGRTVTQRVLERTIGEVSWSNTGRAVAVVLVDWGVAVLNAENLSREQPIFEGSTSDTTGRPSLWDPGTQAAQGAVPLLAFAGKTFRVALPDWRMRMCAIAGGSLTQVEWTDLVNDVEPYTELCPSTPAPNAGAPQRNAVSPSPASSRATSSSGCGPPL